MTARQNIRSRPRTRSNQYNSFLRSSFECSAAQHQHDADLQFAQLISTHLGMYTCVVPILRVRRYARDVDKYAFVSDSTLYKKESL